MLVHLLSNFSFFFFFLINHRHHQWHQYSLSCPIPCVGQVPPAPKQPRWAVVGSPPRAALGAPVQTSAERHQPCPGRAGPVGTARAGPAWTPPTSFLPKFPWRGVLGASAGCCGSAWTLVSHLSCAICSAERCLRGRAAGREHSAPGSRN